MNKWWAPLLLMISCGASAEDTRDRVPTAPQKRFVSDIGSFVVLLRSSPARVPLNELFALTVEVRPTAKVATSGPMQLSMTATMPAHQHGMTTLPKVTSLGDGRFRIDGLLFHMAGEWELSFDVEAGSVREKARTIFRLE